MRTPEEKAKSTLRRHRDEVAIKKQIKIAKQQNHGDPQNNKDLKNPHRFNKRHAMDCGNSQCGLCGNPRKVSKDKLTNQEKKLFQNVDAQNNRHSNGSQTSKDTE
jgi:hypothetical protein